MQKPTSPATKRHSLALRARFALGAALLALACGDDPPPVPKGGEQSQPVGACNAVTRSYTVPSSVHYKECFKLPEPEQRPPSGGVHYARWASFQTYDFPIADGYLIHSMEHGAVVLYYNCGGDAACEKQIAEAQSFLDARPEDPLCAGKASLRRAILLPDPKLDVSWAASAWGINLRADCFDEAAFGDFYAAHYGRSPEALCDGGIAFTESPCQ